MTNSRLQVVEVNKVINISRNMARIVFAMCVLFISCNNVHVGDNKEIKASSEVINREVKDVENHESNIVTENDTCILEGKVIVFFMITQEEFDIVMEHTDHGIEINDSLADFDTYAKKTTTEFANTGIKVDNVRNKIFKIKTSEGYTFFDRTVNNKMFGVIVSDGKKAPLIVEGKILNEKDFTMLSGPN